MRGTLVVVIAALLLLVPISFAAADVAKAEADFPADALRAARTFLRAVADSDDKAAYELTDPAYRKENPSAKFAEQTKTLRERLGLSKENIALPAMSGWVLVNPEAGQPKRGAFTLESNRHASREEREHLMRTTLGVRVEQQGDGRWLVAEARAMDRSREEMRFTQPLVDAAERGNDLRHISSTIRGKVIELKDGSMTIRPDPLPERPTERPKDRTLKLDEKAEVVRITATVTALRRGAPLTAHIEKATPGTVVDVKPGVHVTVEPSEDGERAVRIEINSAPTDGL